MFRNFLKNKKAQNTAEYALLIALVVAGIIAMQQYAQRALQARVRDASVYLANATSVNGMGNTVQYEPYYLQTNYTVNRESADAKLLGKGLIAQQMGEQTNRIGNQTDSYDTATSVGTGPVVSGL